MFATVTYDFGVDMYFVKADLTGHMWVEAPLSTMHTLEMRSDDGMWLADPIVSSSCVSLSNDVSSESELLERETVVAVESSYKSVTVSVKSILFGASGRNLTLA